MYGVEPAFSAECAAQPGTNCRLCRHPAVGRTVHLAGNRMECAAAGAVFQLQRREGLERKISEKRRALCTLYPGLPGGGSFTCLVAVGQKQAMAAEACLGAACSYVQEAYRAAPLLNGARWLMLDVKNRQVLRDVQALLRIRAGAR